MLLRYISEPPELSLDCDGYEAKISISRVIDCNKSGLVTTRHNESRDGVADLTSKSCIPLYVHNGPLVHTRYSMQSVNSQLAGLMRGVSPSLNKPHMTK